MRFIIATRSKDTADEIRWSAKDTAEIEVPLGSFESLSSFDCVATAGNSFGLMDAGMDLAVLKFFGVHIQERIQKRIIEGYCGEQPVGSAFIVETGRLDHPYVAACSHHAGADEHCRHRSCVSGHLGDTAGCAPAQSDRRTED